MTNEIAGYPYLCRFNTILRLGRVFDIGRGVKLWRDGQNFSNFYLIYHKIPSKLPNSGNLISIKHVKSKWICQDARYNLNELIEN